MNENNTWYDGSPVSYIDGDFEYPLGLTKLGWVNNASLMYGMCKRFECYS